MQYPVIYAVLSRLNHCYSFSHYCAILLENGVKEESQKMDDLSVLVTCWFGTLGTHVCFPAKLTVLLVIEVLNNH